MRLVDTGSVEYNTFASQLPYLFSEKYAAFEKSRGFQYVILTDGNDTFIPLKISKRVVFHIGIFTHAPVNIARQLGEEEGKEFLEAACTFSKQQFKCIRIEPASTLSLFRSTPSNAKFIELGLFSTELDKTEDEIFGSFNSNYRNEIRNAEKSAIEIRQGRQEVKNFYACYADTHKRQGIPHEGLSFFETFYDKLGDEYIACFTAYYNNTLEAGIFVAFTGYGAYYLYAGSAARPLLKGSTKKIIWECMKAVKAKGTKQFVLGGARYKNVEGTKYEGIQNFKRRFGATVSDGYIWKKDLDTFSCRLYDLLFWAKCTLRSQPVPKDIIDSQLD